MVKGEEVLVQRNMITKEGRHSGAVVGVGFDSGPRTFHCGVCMFSPGSPASTDLSCWGMMEVGDPPSQAGVRW